MKLTKASKWGLFLLLVHVSGFIGMFTEFRTYFLMLTPVTLTLCFASLIYFQEEKDRKFYFMMSTIVILGFLIELIGVNTGWPFGVYTYGEAFGPQLWQTPLVIGLNWFVLTFCGAYVMQNVTRFPWIKALVAGALVTLIDVILEPVAINSNYWTWQAESVPIQNYITWFVCITVFARFIYYFKNSSNNPIAIWVLGSQLIFFIAMRITYWQAG